MSRHIFRISLVMLLGVVTSVTVAWGICIRWHQVKGSSVKSVDDPDVRWIEVHCPEPPAVSGVYRAGTTGVLRDSYATVMGRRARVFAHRVEAGWPFHCVTGGLWERVVEDPDKPGGATDGVHGVTAIILGEDDDLLLTYGPIFPGLLANTAIYGIAWWVMLFGPGMLIRWRRRCAGRCAKCGYDLRGAVVGDQSSVVGVVCPECGHGDDKVTR